MREAHAHDVLQMMATSGITYTRESLVQAVLEQFGEDTRFHTCAGQGMNAEEIVAFIEARGKLMGPEDDLRLDPSKQCSHE